MDIMDFGIGAMIITMMCHHHCSLSLWASSTQVSRKIL